jgi:hypothetical protein
VKREKQKAAWVKELRGSDGEPHPAVVVLFRIGDPRPSCAIFLCAAQPSVTK